MAGAQLKFENGFLGFERVSDPHDGDRQYLRAVIHSNATGRTTSAPIDQAEAAKFLLDAMEQVALSLGYDRERLLNMALVEMVEQIRAERD